MSEIGPSFKFKPRLHLLSILVLLLLFVPNSDSWKWKKDPSYKLFCYKGSKLVLGHDPREENIECKSVFGIKQYCYRFIAHTPAYDMVKLGCASLLCNPFRNTCADFEMGGVAGTLCCCNDMSYCNEAPSKQISTFFLISLFSFSIYLLQKLF